MHQTVSVIFEDPGVQELLVKVYQKGEAFTLMIFCLRFSWFFWSRCSHSSYEYFKSEVKANMSFHSF